MTSLSHDNSDPAALAVLARRIAVQAGRHITEHRPRTWSVDTKISATDVVTQMDVEAEQLITRAVRQSRPHDGLYGEELGSSGGDSLLTWVIDPIDGTVNYLYGLDNVAVCVAVVRGDPTRPGAWSPLVGAVAHGGRREVMWAWEGGGAWYAPWDAETASHPSRCLMSEPADLTLSLIGTGFSYDASIRSAQGSVVGALLPQVRDIRRLGSAALDICAVARGELDGFYESCLRPWDVAAAWCIAQEAGAEISGWEGNAPDESLTVVSAPSIAAELRMMVHEEYRRCGVKEAVHEVYGDENVRKETDNPTE